MIQDNGYCEYHPPLDEWPIKNLEEHICPERGKFVPYANRQIERYKKLKNA